MARRRMTHLKALELGDPKRREWTAGGLRLWPLIGAARLVDDAERQAWSMAWRRFLDDQGPLPIARRAFEAAIAAWPSRAGYPAIVAAWRAGRATDVPRGNVLPGGAA